MDEILDEALTTSDNPYDFFGQFDEWYAYDTQKGYNTCGLVDRLSVDISELPDELASKALHDAYVAIARMSPEVIGFDNVYYKIVTRSNPINDN